MTRRTRLILFAVGGGLVAAMLVVAFTGLPRFGSNYHPYGDRAVHAAVAQRATANVVSSVNFDQRAFDTLGEEFILFASVIGTVVLLRQTALDVEDEAALREAERDTAHALGSTSLVAFGMLLITTLVGFYIIAHGHLSPGGGFQGGVIVATGIHLLYVGRGYAAIRRGRPASWFEILEALGAGGFAVLGLAAAALTGDLLANVVPTGTFNSLLSGGTVDIFNGIVGLEVTGAMVVMLAKFLQQYVEVSAVSSQP